MRRRFRCETTAELLARAAEARAELEALDAGVDPAEAARRRSRRPRRGWRAVSAALREAREQAGEPFADAVAAELHGIGMGDGEFRVELARARAGRHRRGRGRVPDPAEPRAAVRAGRRDRLRRRAVADRARDRRGRRRRDDGLRRDRRRHRRPDRPRRRRHARAARRAGAGDHDHAPAPDREPRRPALPGREGAGRPDPHADPGAVRRTSAKRRSSVCSAAASSSPRSSR